MASNPAHNKRAMSGGAEKIGGQKNPMRLRCALAGLMLGLAAAILSAQVSGREAANPSVNINAGPAAVKNAPFSAEVVTDYDRKLDNGGHIHRETWGKVFRDSLGRMRTETEMPATQPGAGKFEHVAINDPVQKVIINLDPKVKTATVLHFGQGVGPTTLSGVPTNAPLNVAPGAPGQRSAEPRPMPGMATTSKMNATLSTAPVNIKTESLGTRHIEGVSATGTRTTRIIDAGSMGNDKPIVSVSESWFSPELRMTVLAETDDGQSGHSTMKVLNITRTEPVAQLFQVPADYTVKETNPATASVKH